MKSTNIVSIPDGCHAYIKNRKVYIEAIHVDNVKSRILTNKTMDYEKIKEKLLEIEEMMSEIPQNCKGNSANAHYNRMKYIAVKSKVDHLIEIL